ncbi:MAG: hypothetical protein KGQ83_10235 [Planctomycetes bacterium]|nr:hypothetical protein [Planctomycetota bacterium]
MARTAVFPEWLGLLGIGVALLYILGLVGKLVWSSLATTQVVAFFLFLLFVILIGLRLIRAA